MSPGGVGSDSGCSAAVVPGHRHIATATGRVKFGRRRGRKLVASPVAVRPDRAVVPVRVMTLRRGQLRASIELIEPLGEDSPIAKFLENNSAGAQHHVCYEVEDIEEAQPFLVSDIGGGRIVFEGSADRLTFLVVAG